jgi:hypothetical protein
MPGRTRKEIGEQLIRALKRKWGPYGRIVCGNRGHTEPVSAAEVADLLGRVEPPRISNFGRMAAETAVKRMGRRTGAAKYLGVPQSYLTKKLGPQELDE